jgi:hypothetical protein
MQDRKDAWLVSNLLLVSVTLSDRRITPVLTGMIGNPSDVVVVHELLAL